MRRRYDLADQSNDSEGFEIYERVDGWRSFGGGPVHHAVTRDQYGPDHDFEALLADRMDARDPGGDEW